MDLSDALGDWPSGGNQSGSGGMWSSNNDPNPNPWAGNPSQPPNNPAWPGPGGNPVWPGPGGNPSQPTWPSQPQHGPGAWPSPSSGPGPAPSHPTGPLTVPYTHSLQSGVYDKLLIIINGVIKANPNMFTLDVCAGSDIAFHFNPRFNENGKKVIVRNSCLHRKWGTEERELSHFPFVPGQPFEMKILCTNREFKVAVNGSHLLEFKHREKNLSSIRSFGIYNDVTLTSVNTQTLP